MRIKTGPSRRRKHNKIFELAKGYRMTRRRLVKSGAVAVLHAGQYAFDGRKLRKRDLRSLWITRINSALSTHNLSYSRFIAKLKNAKIEIDRKILAELVSNDPKTFSKIVEEASK